MSVATRTTMSFRPFRFFSFRTASILSLLTVTTAVAAGCSSEPASDDESDEGAIVSGGAQLPEGYAMAWNGGQALPEAEKWSAMYANAERFAENINAGSQAFSFTPKGSGGSSVYAFVNEAGARKGVWSPPNAATYIPEEIFAFTLSRLFGHSDWAAPATRVTLNKAGADNYEAVVKSATNGGVRGCNLEHQLRYRALNPNYFIGVYKEFVPSFKPEIVPHLVANNGLNQNHSLAKLLQRGARKATDAPVYLVRKAHPLAGSASYDIIVQGDAEYAQAPSKAIAISTEKEAVAQLNHMLVVDLLNGQRDRYGNGTNMSVFVDGANKKFVLALVDNGGGATAIIDRWVRDFTTKVTRFDPELAKSVLELNDFWTGSAPSYKGFTDKDALWRALGAEDVDNVNVGSYAVDCKAGLGNIPSFPSYKARWDKKRENFTKLLRIAADHIRANNEPFAE